MKVTGQDNIVNLFKKELDSRWNILEKRHTSNMSKILFTLLLMINRFSQRIHDEDNYLRVPILLHTLDEILHRGFDTISIVSDPEFKTYVELILQDFQYLGVLRERMELSIAYKEQALEYANTDLLYKIPMQLEEAFNDWCSRPFYDQDWDEYWNTYLKESETEIELKKMFKSEFLKKHGITPMQLYGFDKYLQSEVRNNPDEQAIPFFQFTSENLYKRAQIIMEQEGPVNPLKLRSFLKKLEYNSERNWATSPLLRVQLNQSKLITVLLPSVFLGNVLSGAWLQKTLKGTRSEGKQNKIYGECFEEYVREIFREQGLSVNSGNLRIKSRKFPEICKCTQSSKIDIDVVAQSDTHVYLISCKAKNQNLGPKQLLNFFLYEYRTFFGDIIWDLDKAGEIEGWTTCVAKSSTVMERFDFTGKKLVPMFVTPDARSLSLKSVRHWCIDERITEKIPETVIIRACDLKDYEFQ